MSYACDICGKGKQFGHNVSFSQRKTGKVWKPNLQRQYINLGASRVQVKICTQCLRTLDKYRVKAAEKDATLAVANTPAETPATETAEKPKAKSRKTAAKTAQ